MIKDFGTDRKKAIVSNNSTIDPKVNYKSINENFSKIQSRNRIDKPKDQKSEKQSYKNSFKAENFIALAVLAILVCFKN